MFERSWILSSTLQLFFVSLTLVLVLSPTALHAQILYGSLVGNVTDPTGAAVPGAAVTITNKGTGLSRETTTNDAGEYSFTNVITGSYDVKVVGKGFSPHLRTDVQITINNVSRVDFSLEVGKVAESVIVTAQTPLLQADRAEVRSEVPSTELENLPVPMGRNYQQLFRTLPGFTPPTELQLDSEQPFACSDLQRQRGQFQHQQYAYRWRKFDERFPPAQYGLCPVARGYRDS